MNAITLNTSLQICEASKYRIIQGIRYLCLFLFVYTAYAKIVDHTRFQHGLTRVHLIHAYSGIISVSVPVVEIIVSLLLIFPKTAKVGFWMFIVTMAAFTIYIISAMIWEPKLPCHCGGAIEKLTWMQHVWFNLVFILLAAFALRLLKLSKSLKSNYHEKF